MTGIKTFYILLLGLFLVPSSTYAKVTHLWEYKQNMIDQKETTSGCEIFGSGWSTTPCGTNNEVTKQIGPDGKACYKCSCSASKYPYASCPSAYFTVGQSCTANGVTQYASCTCKSPFRPSTDFVANAMSEFSYSSGLSMSSKASQYAFAMTTLQSQENGYVARDTDSAVYDTSGKEEKEIISSTGNTSGEENSGSLKGSLYGQADIGSGVSTGETSGKEERETSPLTGGSYDKIGQGSSVSDEISNKAEFDPSKPTALGVKGEVLLTCYKPSLFNCSSGSRLTASDITSFVSSSNPSNLTVKLKGENPFIEYTAKGVLKSAKASDNIYCTTGASLTGPLLSSTSRPSDKNKCAEYAVGTGVYSPYLTYGYFNGNCSTNGDCVSADASTDCIIYGGTAVTTYDALMKRQGTVTCKYVTGCMDKLVTINGKKVICATDTVNTNTYYTTTPVAAGSVSCKKITGCAAPYEQVHFGNVTTTDYGTENNQTYEVHKLQVGTGEEAGMVICRQNSGCALPRYDYSCSSSNWNGWLALWENNAPK